MRSKIKSLVGSYKIDKATLSKDGTELRICKRQSSTNKPSSFIVDRTDKQGKGQYISSLYPLSDCKYKFDYNGINYQLVLDDDSTATIIKVKAW